GTVLTEAAYVKDDLHDRPGAIKLARACAERYPDSASSRIALSRLLWRDGKIAEGTQEIRSGYPISYWDWCHVVGEEFAEEFATHQKDTTMKAFGELISAKVPAIATSCAANSFADAGNFETAFAMLTEMNKHGTGDLRMFVDAYGYLRKSKGKEE